MLSNEAKMIVAENCPAYEPRFSLFVSNIQNISRSCDNCNYYFKDKCQKGFFHSILKKISIN